MASSAAIHARCLLDSSSCTPEDIAAIAHRDGPVPVEQRLRIGIMGAAGIAKKVWRAMHAAGHTVVAVACRDPAAPRATAFVAECTAALGIADAPRLCTYDGLVSAEDVQLAYVPIPVTARDEWITRLLAAGKHVVGEKPPAPDAATLRRWVANAAERGLLYMDGTMLSHGARVLAVQAALRRLGPVRRVTCNFAFNGGAEFEAKDIRCDPALEPHGALGDLGWYCTRWILHCAGARRPTRASGNIISASENGAIMEFAGELEFDSTGGDPFTATFFCSFRTAVEQRLTISCAEGTIDMDDCTLPFTDRPEVEFGICRHTIAGEGMTVAVRHGRERCVVEGEAPDFQEIEMWRDAAAATLDSDLRTYWGELAVLTHEVMESMLNAARKAQ